jgi:hypothetical protein
MTSIADGLWDDLPNQCPGCGQVDTPAQDGPSKLMILWVWQLSTYLCLACKDGYATWLGTNWTTELDKDGNTVNQADLHKPKCLQNIEAIQRGAEPEYKSWANTGNPMGMGYCPPCPTDH